MRVVSISIWYQIVKLRMNVTKNEALYKSDKVCRLCLSRKRVMLPIFYEDETSFPMVSRILTYIGIEVSFSSELHFKIALCKECTVLGLPVTSYGITNQTT